MLQFPLSFKPDEFNTTDALILSILAGTLFLPLSSLAIGGPAFVRPIEEPHAMPAWSYFNPTAQSNLGYYGSAIGFPGGYLVFQGPPEIDIGTLTIYEPTTPP